MAYHIFFTGGGSGGHVIPAITLIKELQGLIAQRSDQAQWHLAYIGGKAIEAQLIPRSGIPFYQIQTGKLRRYFSWQNFTDMMRILVGIFQAWRLLWKYRHGHTLVCGMGGFVAVPVVVAARLCRIKIIIHEQTCQAGLANRLAARFAHQVWLSFAQSKKFFPPAKTVLMGYPVRPSCFLPLAPTLVVGPKDLAGETRPILLVTGGGNGSALLNNWVVENLTLLSSQFFIVHQVGAPHWPLFKDKIDANYLPIDLLGPEIIELFKKATVVISRSGAGTVCELMALKKRSIFVPLKIAQNNEQLKNAQEAQKLLGSLVIEEDEFKTLSAAQVLARWQETRSAAPTGAPEVLTVMAQHPARVMAQNLVENCQK